jgi:hypothetical protein
MRLFLLLALLAAATAKDSIVIANPGYYPRVINVNKTNALAAADHPDGSTRRIMVFNRTIQSPVETWEPIGIVVEDNNTNVDMSNGYLFEYAPGIILCAYRHHIPLANGTMLYRIQISRSIDNGVSWSFLSTIYASFIGVWEPYLARYSSDNETTIHVWYSFEITNGGEQDVVRQTSFDGGLTWTSINSRIHTSGSRNGMPAVVELEDASLLAVFEGFWTNQWGHFTVNSARSFDNGTSWDQRQIIFAPSVSSGFDAGSPQVTVCPVTRKIVTVFMTNIEGNNSIQWPGGAELLVISAFLDRTNLTAPIDWTNSTPGTIPTLEKYSFWPSFFADTADGNEKDAAPVFSLRVAYQANSGAGAVTQGSFCID